MCVWHRSYLCTQDYLMSFNLQIDLTVTVYTLMILARGETKPEIKVFNTIEEAHELQQILATAGLDIEQYTDIQEHTLKLT